jgi:(1->4)-alpha-D-glucan 1-alpha-D-glucosylmutase
LSNIHDGKAKLHVIRRGLEVRRAHPRLFHGGKYTPLHADGGREENIAAFLLSHGNSGAVAVAPRLFAGLMEQGDLAPLGEKAWGEAKLALPGGGWTNVLTGERLDGGAAPLARLLGTFPAALLVKA